LLVVIAFCHKDFHQAQELLRWIVELDPKMPQHKALLVASSQVPQEEIDEATRIAKQTFGRVTAIKQTRVEEGGWPRACNKLFRVAAIYVKENYDEAFYWCEPDCVPLSPGWLTALETEYYWAKKPFMGVIYPWMSATKKENHLTGCAIYPPDIAKYNHYILVAEQLPWDCTRPHMTLRHTHPTHLMHHERGNRVTNETWTFPSQADVRRIDKRAVIFHACKDDTLITRLREKRNTVSYAFDPNFLQAVRAMMIKPVRALLRRGSSYYHSGNLGDIIYGLYAIKLHGGGELVLGPQQNGTMPCMVPITREQFDMALPLLEAQRYLRSVSFTPKYPGKAVQYDLNKFRDHWNNWTLRQNERIHNLCEMHCYAAGVRHLMKQDEPWLEAGEPIWTGKIIVHRSFRYQAKDFPWRELVKRYGREMLFVGLEDEYREFVRQFGRVSYYRVYDFLEMARVIAGGKAVAANQSFPCSLALAMGQRVYQESWHGGRDCMFERETFMNQDDPIEQFEEWLP